MQVRILSIGCDDVIESQMILDQDIQCARAGTAPQAIEKLKTWWPDIILFKDTGSSETSDIELLHEIGLYSRAHKNCRVTSLLSTWDTLRVRKLVQAGVGHFFVWPANQEIVDAHLHRQIEQVKFAKFREVEFKEEAGERHRPAEMAGSIEGRLRDLREVLAELRKEYFLGPIRAERAQALFQKMENQLIDLAAQARRTVGTVWTDEFLEEDPAASDPSKEPGAKILSFPKKAA